MLRYIFRPVYQFFDHARPLRWFAENFIYSEPKFADFFFQGILVLTSTFIALSFVINYQVQYGNLPFWLIYAYNFMWVGFGGRVMGGAYTFAHKEGHLPHLYRPWIRNSVGNIFENWIGCFFGNVPYNFTTSHIAIHHKLNAGKGDTFYQWDFDRSSWFDFMLFLHRIFLHTIGISSLAYFLSMERTVFFNKLLRGCIIFWVIVPAVLLMVTKSWWFLFFIHLQPLFGMTYFLAFMNFGFHGFVEFDENGQHIECVNSIAIVDGDDDYFGEDDHMAHHYATRVFYSDLPAYRETQMEEFKKHHASVFRGFSIVELSLFILLKDWKRLATYYVDYTGKMTQDEIAAMLEVRAKTLDKPN